MPSAGSDQPAVVVLRALGLGDLLVGVPALRAVRRHLPDHRLVLAAPAVLAPLVELTGAVDVLLPTGGLTGIDRPPGEPPPEVVVNLHGSGPESHRVLDALGPRRRIGFRRPGWDGPAWEERPGRHERERWCDLLVAHAIPADPGDLRLRRPDPPADAPGGPYAVVHPGAAFGAKRWPAERFAAVARHLEDDGRRVLLTGSAEERELALTVAEGAGLPAGRVLAGQTDLGRLAALVAGAAVVVSGDTGIAHLASAFATPSVVLFGPVPPTRWGPPADGPHVALAGDAARRGDPFATTPDRALLAISTAMVITALPPRSP